MNWIKGKFRKDDKMWFYLFGLLLVFEVLNKEFLKDTPYQISLMLTVGLIVVATYFIGLMYLVIKEKYKSHANANHNDLLTKLDFVSQELAKTEERINSQTASYYQGISDNLNGLSQQICKVSDTICYQIDVTEKKLISLQEKNKGEVLEDISQKVEIIKNDIKQSKQDTTQRLEQIAERIVEQLQNRSKQLAIEIGKTEKALIDSVKSESNQLGIIIGETKDRLATSFNDLKDQSNKSTEEIMNRTIAAEEVLLATIQSEGSQSSLLIGEMKDHLTQTIDTVRDAVKVQHYQTTETILSKANEVEAYMVAMQRAESEQLGTIIGETKDQLLTSFNDLKDQSNKSTEEIMNRTIAAEEVLLATIQSEGSQSSLLIGEMKDHLTQTIDTVRDAVKEQNHQTTETLLSKANEVEAYMIAMQRAESEQLGTIIGGARDQLATSINDLRDQSNKATEDILNKTRQESLTIVNSINGELVKADTGRKEQIQQVIDGSIKGFNTVSEILSEKEQSLINHLEKMELTAKEDHNLFVAEVETKLNHITILMEKVEINNDDRLKRIKEIIDSVIESMKLHTDAGVEYTIDSLIEKVGQISNRNVSDISLIISEGRHDATNIVKELESKVSDHFGLLLQEQSDIKTLITDVAQTEIKNKDGLIHLLSKLNNTVTELRQEMIQIVISQLSTLKDDQLGVIKKDKDEIEKRFSHVNKQISGLTNKLSTTTEKLEKTLESNISKVVSWQNTETEIGKSILTNLSKLTSLDTSIENVTNRLVDRQETYGQKVDVLINSMNSLIHVIKLSEKEGKVSNVSVEETQKGKSRTEKIKDDENGILLINQFEHDVLRSSEMYQSGKKVYAADYDTKGLMISSKNFDKAGKVLTEMTYYPNGAVKERKENIRKNGKNTTEISHFDQSGRKIK